MANKKAKRRNRRRRQTWWRQIPGWTWVLGWGAILGFVGLIAAASGDTSRGSSAPNSPELVWQGEVMFA